MRGLIHYVRKILSRDLSAPEPPTARPEPFPSPSLLDVLSALSEDRWVQAACLAEQAAHDAITPETRSLFSFYERLGGRPLPVVYTCPPVSEEFDPVPYLLMVRTYPPGRPITRQDALEVVQTGLVEVNQVPPESPWLSAAIRAVEAAWSL